MDNGTHNVEFNESQSHTHTKRKQTHNNSNTYEYMNEYEGSKSVNTNIVKAVLSYVMSSIFMYLCTKT